MRSIRQWNHSREQRTQKNGKPSVGTFKLLSEEGSMVSSELSDGSAARIGSQGNLNLCHKVIIEQRRKGCQRDLDLGNRVGRQEGRKEASKQGRAGALNKSTPYNPRITNIQ